MHIIQCFIKDWNEIIKLSVNLWQVPHSIQKSHTPCKSALIVVHLAINGTYRQNTAMVIRLYLDAQMFNYIQLITAILNRENTMNKTFNRTVQSLRVRAHGDIKFINCAVQHVSAKLTLEYRWNVTKINELSNRKNPNYLHNPSRFHHCVQYGGTNMQN